LLIPIPRLTIMLAETLFTVCTCRQRSVKNVSDWAGDMANLHVS